MENSRRITSGKLIRWAVLGISLAIYLTLFARFFSQCQPAESRFIHADERIRAKITEMKNAYPVATISTGNFMSVINFGGIERAAIISDIVYLEASGVLQLTLRLRERDKNDFPHLNFTLHDRDDGKIFRGESLDVIERGGYVYYRLHFGSDIKIDTEYHRAAARIRHETELAAPDGSAVPDYADLQIRGSLNMDFRVSSYEIDLWNFDFLNSSTAFRAARISDFKIVDM